MSQLQFFNHPFSNPSYKVRLTLALLQVPFESHQVELMKGAQHSPEFLSMNPCGKVPTIKLGDFCLWESNAIVFYLAHQHQPNHLLPANIYERSQMHQWIQFEATTLSRWAGYLRFQRLLVPAEKQNRTAMLEAETNLKKALRILDDQLGKTQYLAGAGFSCADIAVYAYAATLSDTGVDLESYSHLQAWMSRVERLPHFVSFGS